MSIKTISISDQLWEEILAQAKSEERSVSLIVRDLIKGYLARVKRREDK